MKLGANGLQKVSDAIQRMDPEGKFVKFMLTSGAMKYRVEYSSDFISHESIGDVDGHEEEAVRAFILCWLCTAGQYLPVNIEIEKRYSIGRPKIGAELDILIKRTDGTPYLLMEVKAPNEYDAERDQAIEGQLFNIAPHEAGCEVLSYATLILNGDEVKIRCLSIAYGSYNQFAPWKDAGRPGSSEVPINYGEVVHEYFGIIKK